MKKIFSFSGRARRTEYWITYFVVSLLGYALEAGTHELFADVLILALAVLMIWVGLAVGARRCHDLGHNGFWQLIPFYGIWMAFVNGQPGPNEYGDNPKGE